MYYLGFGFFLTALFYAAIGFGGGSTYTALLTLTQIDFHILPLISLFCNLLVVSGSSYLYIKYGHLNIKLSAALGVFSIPAAWFGSQVVLNKNQFLLILGCSLMISGIILLTEKERLLSEKPVSKYNALLLGPMAGVPLGFLAGITGIGGGIFLAPLLHHLKMMPPRAVAAITSFFILINSITGLIGHLIKLPQEVLSWSAISPYLLLPCAVLLGGQVGSRLGINLLSSLWIKRFTAILILYVSGQLLWKVT